MIELQPASAAHRRLALGTVQFGMNYGVANASGQVTAIEVARILDAARAAGLDTLDTAIAYGDSEAVLGRAGVSDWHLITKLPALPPAVRNAGDWVVEQIRGSLGRLGVKRIDAVLLHRPFDLLGPQGPDYLAGLEELERLGLTNVTGISIYDPSELDAIWPRWQPRLVQAPMNVLDRRLIDSGWLARLHAHDVRVHVRSIFLQGLLLMTAERRPAYFQTWAPILDRWLDWCLSSGLAPREAALAFVAAQPEVERLVVGVDSMAQLHELLGCRLEGLPLPGAELRSDDLALLEPSRWKTT